jgi:hypothetical protein
MMARDEEPRRVEVGFSGGQAIAIRLTHKGYESLRKDVQRGSGWIEVETADGPVSVDAAAVVFIRLDTGEHQVGFSGL